MSFVYLFGIFALGAYLLQILFGLKQIKHFNQNYQQLRKKGKVAIGCRAGKIKAGTIVLFAVDPAGIILDARKMQGVTVLAKFKELPVYLGEDIHYIDKYHPNVQKENKLTIQAMENAREIYLRTEAGNYTESQGVSPVTLLKIQIQTWKEKIYMKEKRSAK